MQETRYWLKDFRFSGSPSTQSQPDRVSRQNLLSQPRHLPPHQQEALEEAQHGARRPHQTNPNKSRRKLPNRGQPCAQKDSLA